MSLEGSNLIDERRERQWDLPCKPHKYHFMVAHLLVSAPSPTAHAPPFAVLFSEKLRKIACGGHQKVQTTQNDIEFSIEKEKCA
ncbi:hypothetical protein Fmac_031327 [Flemingia macrophylla]|uniref:Uncharacterized protein n=1 Tax=Flemingia macrophylla TaxID=520843 RepID=A0ABD1L1R4_9FABA